MYRILEQDKKDIREKLKKKKKESKLLSMYQYLSFVVKKNHTTVRY